MAGDELEELTGGLVSIGSARLDLSGIIHLTDVSIRARELAGEGAEIFRTDDIVLICDKYKMWRGHVQPIAIRLRHPIVTLAEIIEPHGPADAEAQRRFNIQYLRFAEETDQPERWPALPRVEVEEALLRFGEIRGGQFSLSGEVAMRGQVSGDESQAGLFHMSLVEMNGMSPRAGGLKVTGSIDVEKAIAQAEIKGLSLNDRYRHLLPSAAREIWTRLDATGNLPTVQFAYDRVSQWRTLVKFDDVAMLLPELPGAGRRYRMTGVKGALRFEPNRIRITEPLVGQIEGLVYTLAGTFYGYEADARFEIGLETEPFDIPTQQQDIYALPLPVQDVFRMLTPAGRLERLSMKVWRDAGEADESGSIKYEGTATVSDARARYFKFPYELQQCHGKIAFNADVIRVLSLAGKTEGGGVATIYGSITASSEAPGVDLHITAVDVPLDKSLYNALDPRHRPALDLFFNEAAYADMKQRGHFISLEEYNQLEESASQLRRQIQNPDALLTTGEQEAIKEKLAKVNEALERPAFDLGGRANLTAHISREPTVEAFAATVADVDILEASIVFKHFPYPLIVSSGKLRIEPGLLTFSDLRAKGLHGGECGLSGTVSLSDSPEPSGPTPATTESDMMKAGSVKPDLNVHALSVPIDELLLDALPRPQDRPVRDLKPEGNLSMVGRIFHSKETQRTDVSLLLDLQHARAAPGDGQFKLERLAGRVLLSLGEVRFEEVHGYRGQSQITLNGKARWEDQTRHIDMRVDGRRLEFSDPLLSLIEPYVKVDDSWKALLKDRQPRGEFDALVVYRQTGELDRLARIAIEPKSISYLNDGRRITLGQTSGRIVMEAGSVQIDKLSGKLGACEVLIDGRLKLGPDMTADLSMQARGPRVDEPFKQAMPASMLSVVNSLKLDGKFELDLSKVYFAPNAGEGRERSRVQGVLRLSGGKADLGLDLEGIDGQVGLDLVWKTGQAHAEVEAKLQADRIGVRGRPLTEVSAQMRSAPGGAVLKITDVSGRMYGGAMAGDGTLWVEKQDYEFRMALSGVPLHRFIYMDKPATEEQARMDGDLSASFSVEGNWAKAQSLRGRGRIQVTDGQMYHLPLALGLLQIAHLSLPTTKSFDRADVAYYLKEGVLVFEKIVLQSPHMRMAGDGSLNTANEKLDLTLTSSNPGALDLGPVSDMVDAFRDQFVTVRVTGTLEDPKREIKPFNGLTKAWRDVFGEEPERR